MVRISNDAKYNKVIIKDKFLYEFKKYVIYNIHICN